MGNIITYAEDYRKKSLKEMPFNTTDALILSQISYFDYHNSSFQKKDFDRPLYEFYNKNTDIILKGMMTAQGDKQLIEVLRQGGRHGDLRACCYVDEFDAEIEKQFSAITFELGEKEYYIAFRGTDNTVVGWKEDFAMSYQREIPSQRSAVKYAAWIMKKFPGKYYIGGHSKGGNLAVYAARSLPKSFRQNIVRIYNFDGPGFMEEFYEKRAYKMICKAICKIVPQSSVIGMMMGNKEDYLVVHSTADTIFQHNPYTWVVNDSEFEWRTSVDALSRLVKRCLDGWLEELSLEERKKIVSTVFDIIYNTGITGFYELSQQRFDKIRAFLESVGNVDPEERKRVYAAVRRLLTIAADELHTAAKEESVAQLEKSAALLEKRAVQVESFIQSLQRRERDYNK